MSQAVRIKHMLRDSANGKKLHMVKCEIFSNFFILIFLMLPGVVPVRYIKRGPGPCVPRLKIFNEITYLAGHVKKGGWGRGQPPVCKVGQKVGVFFTTSQNRENPEKKHEKFYFFS